MDMIHVSENDGLTFRTLERLDPARLKISGRYISIRHITQVYKSYYTYGARNPSSTTK